MKTLILCSAFLGLLVLSASLAEAAPKSDRKAAATSQNKSQAKKKLSREIVFSGSKVDGRYHSAGEGVVQVENEKGLDPLIGGRRNFKDRLAVERARLKASMDQGK